MLTAASEWLLLHVNSVARCIIQTLLAVLTEVNFSVLLHIINSLFFVRSHLLYYCKIALVMGMLDLLITRFLYCIYLLSRDSYTNGFIFVFL